MDDETLRGRLPEGVAARLQSLRNADGRVTLILDAGGLDAPAREDLEEAAKASLSGVAGVEQVHVALVADKVKRRLIAVASGKGGVGKSTLAANLAVALHRMGRKVGIVDADIYGPSQPKLLANEGQKPGAREKHLLPVPSEAGVPVLSIGHLVEPGKAVAWRGPMAGNAMGQLIDADWGEVDTLIVDLPPGTGDIQLTMVQRYRPDGAVIVSTPQDLALIDAKRAIHLFGHVNVPVIGIVENMAGYACPHCGEVSEPFGLGGAESAAAEMGLPFLGRVPLALEIRQASDAGHPPAAGEGPRAEAFMAIAAKLADWLDRTGR